jgi:cytochrome b pre-mRNA-processing protein 3
VTWLSGIATQLRRRRARDAAADALYDALVTQARQPWFYTTGAVPDTRDGRLELIYLHAILVMRRLRTEGEPGRALAQALFDLLFLDVDRHLREWGVGDLSVGKHVKQLAQSFYGRAAAVDPLLEAGDVPGLALVLARNLDRDAQTSPAGDDARLAEHLIAQSRWLAGQDGSALLAGAVVFAEPGKGSAIADRVPG